MSTLQVLLAIVCFIARNKCKYNVGTDVVSCAHSFEQISFGMHSYHAKRC